jgi:hypothetical protein
MGVCVLEREGEKGRESVCLSVTIGHSMCLIN